MALSNFLLQGASPRSAADYGDEAAKTRMTQAAGQMQLQSAQDEIANKRRSMAVSLLHGISQEQDPEKQAALYATLKPMAERYDSTLKLPDQYDASLTHALSFSQINPKDMLAAQVDREKATVMSPYQQAQIDALNERNSIMREKMSAATTGKALPSFAIKDLEGKAKNYETMTRLSGGFNDDYGGYMSDTVGDVANWIAKRTDDTGQAQWWQDYQDYINAVRNDLFGAALTSHEKAEFQKAIVTPGMNPKQARANLARQQALMQNALARAGGVYGKGGYNAEQIGEYVPPGLSRVDATSPTLDAQPGQRLQVITPDGQIGTIDAADVDEFLADGGRLVR